MAFRPDCWEETQASGRGGQPSSACWPGQVGERGAGQDESADKDAAAGAMYVNLYCCLNS